MPELPEVEVTRRSVAGGLQGARVQAVEMGLPLRWPLGCPLDDLVGRVAGAMARRGKYLWLPLVVPGVAEGEDPPGLLMHLGMSGALSFAPQAPAPGPWDHFRLHTDQGCLWLTDPRRFGAVVYSAGRQVAPAATLLARLGPEPFDPALTPARFHAALQQRRTPVKQALLSGELVVGAGNIYACEALFLAGIDPRTPCAQIGPQRAARLLARVQDVLAQAITAGGSTLKDFHDANGAAGHYQESARVYGREGEPCSVCGTPIRRLVQAQRSTYHCPKCQRR